MLNHVNNEKDEWKISLPCHVIVGHLCFLGYREADIIGKWSVCPNAMGNFLFIYIPAKTENNRGKITYASAIWVEHRHINIIKILEVLRSTFRKFPWLSGDLHHLLGGRKQAKVC